jgi:drug/metabolite transporter (DMT)-like permease
VNAVILAIFSNICFATASIGFTHYSIKISSKWMNYFKAFIATMGFTLVCLIFNLWQNIPNQAILLFLLSGVMGLGLGDVFLLKAFTHLGSGRVLMIFGFQPLFLGFAASHLFHQDFSTQKFIAVFFLVLCLFSFSLESFKTKGHWDFIGLCLAILGVSMDGIGIILSRTAFEMTPNISPFYANWLRGLAACSVFAVWSLFNRELKILPQWKAQSRQDKLYIFLSAFAGTFLSLSFYLMAIKTGHLASISAIAGTAPLFASSIDFIRGRSKPNIYFWFGLCFFLIGFAILILS